MKPFKRVIIFVVMLLSVFLTSNTYVEATDSTNKEDIYNLQLMKDNHLEPDIGANYSSIDSLINDLIKKYKVDSNKISLAYYNFSTDEHYYINEDKFMIAASTTKVPVAMLYEDLINEGTLTLKSNIAFKPDYYADGAGKISNNPIKSKYTLEDLLYNMIVFSDNSAWICLMENYPEYGNLKDDALKNIGNVELPKNYKEDNYASAKLAEDWLIYIANHPKEYEHLIKLMSKTEPRQLFTSYVKKGMANKYGRLDNLVHDTGIYFENGKPQYVLVVYTKGLSSSDVFLEELNLRVNEYYRAIYLESDLDKLNPNQGEGIKISKQ